DDILNVSLIAFSIFHLKKLRLFLFLYRKSKSGDDLIVTCFTEVERVSFHIFSGKVPPPGLQMAGSLLQDPLLHSQLPAAAVADYLFQFFCLPIILTHVFPP